jgi:hypothetical protein
MRARARINLKIALHLIEFFVLTGISMVQNCAAHPRRRGPRHLPTLYLALIAGSIAKDHDGADDPAVAPNPDRASILVPAGPPQTSSGGPIVTDNAVVDVIRGS